MREAFIVGTVRTPVGRAGKGTLRTTRPDDLAAITFRELLRRSPGIAAEQVEDVILGCAMPEAEQGMNMARIAALRAGLPHSLAGATINRFCASGLEAIAIATQRVTAGAECILAGGSESMTLVPIGGFKPSPNPWLMEHLPTAYMNMGLTAERVARQYAISREESDAFALRSHEQAIAAIDAGRFQEEIVPVETRVPADTRAEQAGPWQPVTLSVDEGPRRDTSMAALAALRPVFHAHGRVTAGNSSPMSDGAAAALVASGDLLRQAGIQPEARLVAYATAGVDPAIMGIGPVVAIPLALRRASLPLDAIDVIELNEAFAAQALAVIRTLGLDAERVNVNGGAIALGHPLGCTGAKLTATLLAELRRRKARYGMVTMCVGGGMGAAGIFENLRR